MGIIQDVLDSKNGAPFNTTMKSLRFVDLFSGLGGFHVALRRLGGRCVFAAEWQDHLRELYRLNFGLYPEGDIRKIRPDSVPDHDLLAAGFPCQPFSKAGDQMGFECTEQGGLFFDVVKILKTKKPRYFILENVPNLLKHRNGMTWDKISSVLTNDLGYNVKAEKFSPHQFGIPQIRERVYIVGSRKPLLDFHWPTPICTETTIESVLDDHPVDARRLSPQVEECLEVWERFLKLCPKSTELPYFPLWSMEWGATYPYEDATPFAVVKEVGMDGLSGFKGSHGIRLGGIRNLDQRWEALPSHARTKDLAFPKWKQKFIGQNRQFYRENKKWIDPWMPSITKFPSSLQKLEWNVKGGKRDIWSYVIQFRASGVRVKRRTTAPSLIAMTDTQVPIIAWQKRYMTPRECARLQCLEELKVLPSSRTKAFAALGNAVNSEVVEKVARALLRSGERAVSSTRKVKKAA